MMNVNKLPKLNKNMIREFESAIALDSDLEGLQEIACQEFFSSKCNKRRSVRLSVQLSEMN